MEYRIERLPHDRENKYLCVSTNTVRYTKLSGEAFRLLMILLTNTDTFKVDYGQLCSYLPHLGNQIHGIIKELVLSGHLSIQATTYQDGSPQVYYWAREGAIEPDAHSIQYYHSTSITNINNLDSSCTNEEEEITLNSISDIGILPKKEEKLLSNDLVIISNTSVPPPLKFCQEENELKEMIHGFVLARNPTIKFHDEIKELMACRQILSLRSKKDIAIILMNLYVDKPIFYKMICSANDLLLKLEKIEVDMEMRAMKSKSPSSQRQKNCLIAGKLVDLLAINGNTVEKDSDTLTLIGPRSHILAEFKLSDADFCDRVRSYVQDRSYRKDLIEEVLVQE